MPRVVLDLHDDIYRMLSELAAAKGRAPGDLLLELLIHPVHSAYFFEITGRAAAGPACIECDPVTGVVTREEWRTDGKLDRAGGPAFILRDDITGIVACEAWWKDGKIDRADGPAFIDRDEATGTVTYEEWWKDGKPIAPPATVPQASAASSQ
jgi:hypothetical protein